MIVRILGEGQLAIDGDAVAELQSLDSDLEAAVEHNDQAALDTALEALLSRARGHGKPLPPDSLEPSDVIIPHQGATLAEVRKLLTDEGLIPG
ncbi:MAG: PspA-associated protein PspAA [Streptosporangiaceae bacterium]